MKWKVLNENKKRLFFPCEGAAVMVSLTGLCHTVPQQPLVNPHPETLGVSTLHNPAC